MQNMDSNMDEARCSWFFSPLLLVVGAEIPLQGARYDETTGRGCLRRTHPLIKISRAMPNMRGRRRGYSREISLRNGSPSRPHPCYGSMGNVRPSVPSQPDLILDFIALNHCSGFGEEHPLVRSHLSSTHRDTYISN